MTAEYAPVTGGKSAPKVVNIRRGEKLLHGTALRKAHGKSMAILKIPSAARPPACLGKTGSNRKITPDIGSVVAWGEIFSAEQKVTRDKQHKIYRLILRIIPVP